VEAARRHDVGVQAAQGVKFSDGSDFDAKDVIADLQARAHRAQQPVVVRDLADSVKETKVIDRTPSTS